MIKRLRPKYSDERLGEIYSVKHDHTAWPDHIVRVKETLELAEEFLSESDRSAADLSCGDGYILRNLPYVQHRIYGDYMSGYEFVGPIERTINELQPVDVYVCCETLEHLDDPLTVLKLIREKTKKLILSTPLNEQNDENPEHYWGWDKVGIATLAKRAGFHYELYRQTPLQSGWYQFQIWGFK